MGLDKPQTKTIEGHTWVVTPFPGRPANKYKARLVKMVGPAIAELVPALLPVLDRLQDKKGKLANVLDLPVDWGVVPKIASTLAQHVDEDVLVDTQVELMAMSTRDGSPMTPEQFDIVFAGNDLEMYKALWFILQVNYPDFLSWAEGRVTGLSLTESPTESPKT